MLRSLSFRLAALAGCFMAESLRAQNLLVTNTQTISGNETYQSVFIGATNASTPSGSLSVTGGAVVTGSERLELGSFAGNTGNTLTVDGAGSALNFSSVSQSRFFIGSQGGSSSVLITNGGSIRIENSTNLAIINTPVMVVGSSAAAGSNSVVVAGAGSTLAVLHGGTGFLGSSTPIRIGDASAGNEFVVRDGAVFNAPRYQVEIGSAATSSNNTVLYTGANTVVTNWNTSVGVRSGGNSLTVADGAVLRHLGSNPSFDVSTTNGVTNTVLITGPGSRVSASLVRLGNAGVANIVISNGGVMSNTSLSTVGSTGTASGSTMLVTGANSLFVTTGSLLLGSDASNTVTTISNGGRLANNFGTLGAGTGTSNRVIVDGGTWSNSSVLRFGTGSGGGHSLLITNGGIVTAGSQGVILGATNLSTGNTILVTGANALLTSGTFNETSIGLRSSSNSVTVENGARFNITGANGFRIGQESTANANSLLVTGSGTVFTNNDSTLVVGRDGSSNSLVLADGAFMRNASLVVSSNASALGNSVLVSGAGTVLSNAASLQVGVLGSGQMRITNSGVVHAGNTLGIGAGSSVISDGSAWIGQGRSAAQSLNVLHANINSNSIAAIDGNLQTGGNVTVGGRGIVVGTGTIQAPTVTFATNSTLSPGNSPGRFTIDGNLVWQGGANYNWEIHDAAGGAGTGWDVVAVSGSLNLSALTVNSQFNINLWSLSALPQTSGEAVNFNSNQSYTWTILTASNGITGFSSDKFLVNTGAFNGTGGFANTLQAGWGFSIVRDGNNLNLLYAQQIGPEPIPEPGTWAAAALLAGGAALMRWRKRRGVAQKNAAMDYRGLEQGTRASRP